MSRLFCGPKNTDRLRGVIHLAHNPTHTHAHAHTRTHTRARARARAMSFALLGLLVCGQEPRIHLSFVSLRSRKLHAPATSAPPGDGSRSRTPAERDSWRTSCWTQYKILFSRHFLHTARKTISWSRMFQVSSPAGTDGFSASWEHTGSVLAAWQVTCGIISTLESHRTA